MGQGSENPVYYATTACLAPSYTDTQIIIMG